MKRSFALFLALFVLSAGCASATTGTAVIRGTSEGSPVTGTVELKETAEGLLFVAGVSGLTPGDHGFHVHEKGSCADTGKAAGDHFNPDAAPHGYLPKDGPTHAHAGDLGNLTVGEDGTGHLEAVIPQLTLREGKYSVAGRSLIIHEKADKFVQPSGDAGGRIGCGQIVVTEQSAG